MHGSTVLLDLLASKAAVTATFRGCVVFVHASVRVVESATRIMVVVLPYLTGECDDYMFSFSHGGDDDDDGKYCLLWRSFSCKTASNPQ